MTVLLVKHKNTTRCKNAHKVKKSRETVDMEEKQ